MERLIALIAILSFLALLFGFGCTGIASAGQGEQASVLPEGQAQQGQAQTAPNATGSAGEPEKQQTDEPEKIMKDLDALDSEINQSIDELGELN